jgi:CII-binding regulator of phage lambda lysogenization HflD
MPYKNPEKKRDYQREYKRLQRLTPAQVSIPLEFKLKTAQDILELLAEQICAVKRDPEAGTLEKARTIGYLASIALRAVETAELEVRVEEIERMLENREEVLA